MKKTLTVLAAVIFIVMFIAVPVLADSGAADTTGSADSADSANGDYTPTIKYYQGVVLKVDRLTYVEDSSLDYNTVKQTSEVEILTGPYKGRVYTVENSIQLDDPKRLELAVDDKVMLSAELTQDGEEINNIYIYDFYRVNWLLIAAAVAFAVLIAVCLGRGVKALVNMIVFVVLFYFYYVPLVLKGISPVLLMLPVCFAFAFINILWDLQMSSRGFSALASALLAMCISGLVGMLTEKLGHTVGLGDTELNMLMYSQEHVALNFTGLSFALSMLISLGAVVNVSVYVSEYMFAYKQSSPYVTISKLFKYGMDVGREAVERNVLTLFFAAAASMAPYWIAYSSFSTPLLELLNMDIIATQMFRLFAGMIGIAVSMPLNAWLHSRILKGNSLY